jgi:hypothetical protein
MKDDTHQWVSKAEGDFHVMECVSVILALMPPCPLPSKPLRHVFAFVL